MRQLRLGLDVIAWIVFNVKGVVVLKAAQLDDLQCGARLIAFLLERASLWRLLFV